MHLTNKIVHYPAVTEEGPLKLAPRPITFPSQGTSQYSPPGL